MKPLTIELTKGAKRPLQSVGWKSRQGKDFRRQFFALTQDGEPLVITPKAAMPDYYHPNREVRAIFSCDPFPEAVCVEISPCRLLPPPCYQSREDFEAQLPRHSTFEPWKWIYWQTHRQVLLPEPADDGPLQARLDKWLSQCTYVAMESGHPKACVLADVFHLHKGGSDFRALGLLSGQAVQVFHMNDFPGEPTREKIDDSYRVYPGDGTAPLTQLVRDLQSTGGRKVLSLELFSKKYWAQDALEVAKTGLAKMQAVVKTAVG